MTRLEVACPHQDCDAAIPVPHDLPEGLYSCMCRACYLWLTWDDGQPRVTRQPGPGAK